MKSKLSKFIITIIFFLIVAVFALFGIILWNELIKIQAVYVPEDVTTIISETPETIDKDIKAPEILENTFDKIQDPNTTRKKEVEYSKIDINKHFYNQLNEYAKIIYRAFESNKENMKTGTYKVDLGSSLSTLLNQPNGQELLGEYYQSSIEAYTYDNPDVFYLSPNKLYLNIETTTQANRVSYYVYINNGQKENYLIDEFSSKEQIDQALSRIEQIRNEIVKNKKSSTYENIKMVHDYLVDNIQYDTTIAKSNIYNIYGALINHEAVCEGYARSFKYLMDGLGIPCTLVIGKGTNSEGQTENHAWNYVQIEDYWYAIDTTWDDPISMNGWVSETSKYRYFLKGSNNMVKDHIPSGQFTEGGKNFSYPALSTKDYTVSR